MKSWHVILHTTTGTFYIFTGQVTYENNLHLNSAWIKKIYCMQSCSVCVCACVHACMCVCVHVYVRAHVCVCVCVCVVSVSQWCISSVSVAFTFTQICIILLYHLRQIWWIERWRDWEGLDGQPSGWTVPAQNTCNSTTKNLLTPAELSSSHKVTLTQTDCDLYQVKFNRFVHLAWYTIQWIN